MKIAVISASGKAGREIFDEASKRGHDVTAIIRDSKKADAFGEQVIIKDLFDLDYADLEKFDVIVDAFGTHQPELLELHPKVIEKLAGLLENKPNRLLVVGGAGSLYVDPEHTVQLFDTPDFPDAFKPLAKAQSKALDVLRSFDDVNWTFISPAADFRFDGPRTGNYILAGEEFTLNSENESQISYADYAIAMVDEIENNEHNKERISVVAK
ncbi:NAD(P)-dependent oxidoreductase [Lactococcus fujiensis]|uniref:NAD(P)-binding domain-containing protein n=1 Tax=Lactococcus fujiensis JCM 16395 TaxID=1291764 RepID=A0A2A5RQE0_9LACT|nr:NAD(P)-dependent oxidoreductase [Lactococcus fujiensis]PCS01599.1 hypothetical protein RT41_GL000363 [Lactococcus fujiensis JCM 16395]